MICGWKKSAIALGTVVLIAWAGTAKSTVIIDGGGDFNVVPLYRALALGGIDRGGDGSFDINDLNGRDYGSNTTPLPLALSNGSVSANGANYSGLGSAGYAGFYASRNFANLTVSNANSADQYYTVAGQGTATTVEFFAPPAAASATFTWHVTGSSSTPGFGQADARLDFAATLDPNRVWNDLFNDPAFGITEFGPGTYTYNLPIALATPINLFYWSSAFTQVPAGSASSSNFTLTANFASTFVLADVDLFDAAGNPISTWTMVDLTNGGVVFDQTGRLAPVLGAVPEPGSVALIFTAVAALAARRRRRT